MTFLHLFSTKTLQRLQSGDIGTLMNQRTLSISVNPCISIIITPGKLTTPKAL